MIDQKTDLWMEFNFSNDCDQRIDAVRQSIESVPQDSIGVTLDDVFGYLGEFVGQEFSALR